MKYLKVFLLMVLIHFVVFELSGAVGKKVYTTKRINPHPPVIDGKLDDPCWAKAGKTSTLFNERSFEPCNQDTIIRVAYDMDNLYIAFECLESDTSSIRAYERRDDRIQIWRDDWVEVKLEAPRDEE